MNAVDTNVLVYALDEQEPPKQAKARQLIDGLLQARETVLLWQVAAELLSCLRKWQTAKRITATDVEAHFRDVVAMFPLELPSSRVFDRAFALHERFSLAHWDSLLLAACKEAHVEVLYSEDLDSATDYDGLTVVNPFS